MRGGLEQPGGIELAGGIGDTLGPIIGPLPQVFLTRGLTALRGLRARMALNRIGDLREVGFDFRTCGISGTCVLLPLSADAAQGDSQR